MIYSKIEYKDEKFKSDIYKLIIHLFWIYSLPSNVCEGEIAVLLLVKFDINNKSQTYSK